MLVPLYYFGRHGSYFIFRNQYKSILLYTVSKYYPQRRCFTNRDVILEPKLIFSVHVFMRNNLLCSTYKAKKLRKHPLYLHYFIFIPHAQWYYNYGLSSHQAFNNTLMYMLAFSSIRLTLIYCGAIIRQHNHKRFM